jgi:hypothetical protein
MGYRWDIDGISIKLQKYRGDITAIFLFLMLYKLYDIDGISMGYRWDIDKYYRNIAAIFYFIKKKNLYRYLFDIIKI